MGGAEGGRERQGRNTHHSMLSPTCPFRATLQLWCTLAEPFLGRCFAWHQSTLKENCSGNCTIHLPELNSCRKKKKSICLSKCCAAPPRDWHGCAPQQGMPGFHGMKYWAHLPVVQIIVQQQECSRASSRVARKDLGSLKFVFADYFYPLLM